MDCHVRSSQNRFAAGRASALAATCLIIAAGGCASHQFQFANDATHRQRLDRSLADANTARGMVGAPRILDSRPFPASPEPPSSLGPSMAGSLGQEPTLPARNVGRPAERGLLGALDNGEVRGRVVNDLGKPEPAVNVVVREYRPPKSLVAEVATDSAGNFRIAFLQPGRQYELIATLTGSGQRLVGSAVAVPPEEEVLIQVRSSSGPPLTQLGNRTSRPDDATSHGLSSRALATTITDPLMARATDSYRSATPGQSPSLTPTSADERGLRGGSTIPVPPRRAEELRPPIELSEMRSNARHTELPLPVEDVAFAGTGLDRLTVYSLEGHVRTLGDLKGNFILLDFFGSWCVPCRSSIPRLNALQRQFGDRGLQVVGVACEYGNREQAFERLREVLGGLEVEYAVVVAPLGEPSELRNQFRVQSYPTLVLLERSGKVLLRESGGDAEVFDRLAQALARHSLNQLRFPPDR